MRDFPVGSEVMVANNSQKADTRKIWEFFSIDYFKPQTVEKPVILFDPVENYKRNVRVIK